MLENIKSDGLLRKRPCAQRLHMTVEPGKIIAVIGSNSAGKTTLMNTISGLIIDTKIKEQRKGGERITLYGTVKFEGEDITDMYPSERVKKGMVLCRERHPIFRIGSRSKPQDSRLLAKEIRSR